MIPEIIVFFTAMAPFVDIKLAIPLGRELGLSTTTTLIFAIAGNIVPAAITLAILKPLSEYARDHSPKIDSILKKIFAKTKEHHSKYADKFQKYGLFFLALFVALPLPGSGTIGGSVVAFLIGLDYWKGLAGVTLGAGIAAIAIAAGWESAFSIWNNLF